MADNKEEEYLNELLNSIIDNKDNDDLNISTEAETDNSTNQNDEDEDMALLSQMLLNDNNDEKELNENHVVEPVMSDDNNSSNDNKIMHFDLDEDNDDSLNESLENNDMLDSLQKFLDNDDVNESKINSDDLLNKSFSLNDDDTSLNNPEDVINENNTDDLSDILALDDGMSVDDIPDSFENSELTEDDLKKISEIDKENELLDEKDTDNNLNARNEEIETSDNKKKSKKNKKNKKETKETKRKFSLKNFFFKFSEEEETDSPEKIKSDENQKIINELYNDDDSIIDLDSEPSKKKKNKKEKKPKEPKPKKEKKPRQEKKPKQNVPREKINVNSIFKMLIFVLIFCAAVIFGSKIVYYKLTIKTAHNYYNQGNYTVAYERVDGVEIWKADKNFFEGLKTIMKVQQGYDSYRNYMRQGMTTEALDALIKAVGRKYKIEDDAVKYNVKDRVESVYKNITDTLSEYGIDEETALNLYDMTDLNEYMNKLAGYGGSISDSNN